MRRWSLSLMLSMQLRNSLEVDSRLNMELSTVFLKTSLEYGGARRELGEPGSATNMNLSKPSKSLTNMNDNNKTNDIRDVFHTSTLVAQKALKKVCAQMVTDRTLLCSVCLVYCSACCNTL